MNKTYFRPTIAPPPQTGEVGVVLILTAILIAALLIVLTFSLSVSEWSMASSKYRAGANTASVSASATLCSTRECYNRAITSALLKLKELDIRGAESIAAFNSSIDAAVASFNDQLAHNVRFPTGQSGKNEWILDGVNVRIQRGRWWPTGFTGTPHCTDAASDNKIRQSLLPETPILSDLPPGPVLPDAKFEPFDRFDGIDWQSCDHNRGTPNFVSANAVRVTLDISNYHSGISVGGLSAVHLIADTVSARVKGDPTAHTFCAAPFAIPVCALVDDDGDYHPASACQFDRFFTDIKRYCTQAQLDAGTCDVLPGSSYSPTTENFCDTGAPWYNKQACQVALAAQMDQECRAGFKNPPYWFQELFTLKTNTRSLPYYEYIGYRSVPDSQELGQGSAECTFNPWPKLAQTSDHYGVVGVSVPALGRLWSPPDKTLEETYRDILASNMGCFQTVTFGGGAGSIQVYDGSILTAIGDQFYIRPGGMTEPESDTVLWSQIIGHQYQVYPSGSPDKFNHPNFYEPGFTLDGYAQLVWNESGFRELGFPYFIGRVNDALGYPYGRTKVMLDAIRAMAPPKLLEDTVAVQPYECLRRGDRDFGVCNSHRIWYDNRCHRNGRYNVPPTDGSAFKVKKVKILPQNNLSCSITAFEYQDPIAGNWSCEDLPPYMPCDQMKPIYGGHGGYYDFSPLDWPDATDISVANYPIWHNQIPVIADTSVTAAPCKGIAGRTTLDAPIDPTHDWKVIGFIRSYMFDADIGAPPPKAPGPSYGADEPRVCDYEHTDVDANGIPDRYPWGFNPTYRPPLLGGNGKPAGPPQNWGAEANCNMARARVACEPGLIGGDYRGMPSEQKAPPAIVFVR